MSAPPFVRALATAVGRGIVAPSSSPPPPRPRRRPLRRGCRPTSTGRRPTPTPTSCVAELRRLDRLGDEMQTAIDAFLADPTDDNLAAAKDAWLDRP